MGDWEKSVAVHMPEIGASSSSTDLSPKTSATGKKADVSFSDLLEQATDTSLPSSAHPECPSLRAPNAPIRTAKQAASKVSGKSKPTAPRSLIPSPALPGKAGDAPTAAHIVGAPVMPVKEISKTVTASVTSDPIALETSGVLASRIVTCNTETESTAAGSVKVPAIVAPRTSNVELLNPVAKAGTGSTSVASVKAAAVVVPVTAHDESASPVADAGARSASTESVKAFKIVGTRSSNVEFLRPVANAGTGLSAAEAARPSRGAEPGTAKDDSLRPTAPVKSGESVLATTAGTVTSIVIGNSTHPDDNAAPSFDELVAASEVVGSEAQNVTTNDVGTSAVHDSKALFMAQSLAPQQNAQLAKNVATVIPNAVAPVRPVDRELTYTPQFHKQSKQTTNLASEPNHASQPLQLVKEAAKVDEHQGFSANSPIANSGRISPVGGTVRGSQLSSNDKSERGGEHEGAAARASDVETKGIQQDKRIPAEDIRNGFPAVIASQALGLSAAKDNSSLLAPNSSAQTHEVATGAFSKPADLDRPEPQPLSADSATALHSAKLVAQPGQAELRVGFKAGEFGNVDIRTSMVRSQVTAQISVEHGELRNLLAVDLPHLQTKLAEHPLTTTNIVLNNYAGGSSSGSRHAYQQNPYVAQGSNSGTESPELPSLPTITESQTLSTQLDIHM